MGILYDQLALDIRLQEGLKSCINCGTCTAICPAAEFYDYDPRVIAEKVQSKNDIVLEELLTSETIWYCGECMSCKTRCPRGNTPGLIIMALRSLSQDTGLFAESEKGRQQLFLKRTVGNWLMNHGYCLYLEGIGTDLFPEQGPIWDWWQENYKDVMERMGANYQGEGPGILRKIPDAAMDEVHKIFELTGATERFDKIEMYSKKKAKELHLDFTSELHNEYIHHVFTKNRLENEI
jgi:heterodisulfide reductase subunit C1